MFATIKASSHIGRLPNIWRKSDEIRALLSCMEQAGHDCGAAIRTIVARARNLRRARFRLRFYRRASLQSQRKLDAVAGDLLHGRSWRHAQNAAWPPGLCCCALRPFANRRGCRGPGQRTERAPGAWSGIGDRARLFRTLSRRFKNRRDLANEALAFVKKAFSTEGPLSFNGPFHQYQNVTLSVKPVQ